MSFCVPPDRPRIDFFLLAMVWNAETASVVPLEPARTAGLKDCIITSGQCGK